MKVKDQERVDEQAFLKEVGARLSEARDDAGETQQSMADKLGVKLQTYQNYEYGKRDMRSNRIISTCAILGCSPSWLLGVDKEGKQLHPESRLLREMRLAFVELNNTGQKKAIEHTKDLTKISEYTSEPVKTKKTLSDNSVSKAVNE